MFTYCTCTYICTCTCTNMFYPGISENLISSLSCVSLARTLNNVNIVSLPVFLPFLLSPFRRRTTSYRMYYICGYKMKSLTPPLLSTQKGTGGQPNIGYILPIHHFIDQQSSSFGYIQHLLKIGNEI